MIVSDLMETLGASALNLPDAKRRVACGYAGDFLSYAMGKAPTDSAWFTVMNNANVCAVATLADVSAVVLCDGVEPDENLLAKAKEHFVNVICTPLSVYGAIKKISANLD